MSSPGWTDRKLQGSLRHLDEVPIHREPQDGEQKWEAELLDFDSDTLTLKREGHDNSETIPRKNVAEIKQLIRF